MNIKSLKFALFMALFAPGAVAAPPTCSVKELRPDTPLPDKSLYQITSTWTNDARTSVQLASFRGRPQIVTMFFANCDFACPILVNDMKWIEAALPENIRTNVGFVLVSFDSRRDTPSALAAYRNVHQLGPNWTLLTGRPDDVQELAALLGVKYKQDPRGQFAHSNLISLLNKDGELVAQQTGLNQSGEDIVSATKRLLPGIPAKLPQLPK